MVNNSSTPIMPLVFFGSGPVAAASLTFLLEHFRIEAVVTKPSTLNELKAVVDRKENIRVFSVDSRRELDALIISTKLESQLGVLVDFGIIVSGAAIDKFRLGILNSHFSLLPLLRGADPISFSILEGHKKTGVSLMLIEPELDTGKLIAQRGLSIDEMETTRTLTHKLISLSNNLLLEYIPGYVVGTVRPRSQPHPSRATYTRKLTKEDGKIDWNKPAQLIEREIRAFSEWPKSYTTLGSIDVVITNASVVNLSGKVGTLECSPKEGILTVYCGDSALRIEKLKPAGKPEMTARAFLAGYASKIM